MNHAPAAAATDPAPITPEVLRDLLRIDAPSGALLVQGIAREVDAWSRGGRAFVYGRLELGNASVRFRTPPEFAPQNGEAVIIKGVLRVETATQHRESWRATHQVTLYGNVIGTWEPREPVVPAVKLPSRDNRLLLDDFVSKNGVGTLAVLATSTVWADINQSFANAVTADQPKFIEANFGSADEFLKIARTVREQHGVRGIVIARGGGDGQEVIGESREVIAELIEMGLPFYVALGHTSDLHLIDKFADQTFHTPSGFGQDLAKAIRKDAYLRRQKSELKEQKEALISAKEKLDHANGRLSKGVVLSWRNLIVLIFVVVALAAGLAWKLNVFPLLLEFWNEAQKLVS